MQEKILTTDVEQLLILIMR